MNSRLATLVPAILLAWAGATLADGGPGENAAPSVGPTQQPPTAVHPHGNARHHTKPANGQSAPSPALSSSHASPAS